MVVVRNSVRAANVIVVGVLYLSVCLVVGMAMVVVLVEMWWWWGRWFGIIGDGGEMVVVVMAIVMSCLKWTPKAQKILVFILLVYYV